MKLDGGGRGKRIVALYLEMGVATMRELAREAMTREFWEEDEMDSWKLRKAMDICRDAVKRDGPNGQPVACPVEKGNDPLWVQPVFMSIEQANFVISERVAGTLADMAKTRHLWEFFRQQFGGGMASLPPDF